ncbi:AfsR/SARP family transcriptional regulator [Nonomuraea dietziae]|uniref:AfsR/SARP family transcriptional regulator n=1 Tax=Nonomuraea dietziae TaxID=65515 RepID=UPI0033C81164
MSGRGVAVALLGPLEVRRDDVQIRLTAGRLRTLLATLAISAGDTVPVERLALALWGEELPLNARRGVQTYVARLRRALGRDVIRTLSDGYLLDVDPDRIDVLRFRRLLAEAGRASGTLAERALVEEALALWRGSPFEGVDSDWLCASASAYLQEARLGAVERRIDLDMAEGRHGELVAELMELSGRHPLREPLWERLLVALGRSGRQAEALACYERLRRLLAEELGTAPSADLRRVHASLLREEPPPDLRSPTGVRQPHARVAVFTGRAADLTQADRERFAGVRVIVGRDGGHHSFLALIWAHE